MRASGLSCGSGAPQRSQMGRISRAMRQLWTRNRRLWFLVWHPPSRAVATRATRRSRASRSSPYYGPPRPPPDGLAGRPRRVPLHARHPPDRLPRQALDDAHVRRLRQRRGDQRALQVSAGAGPDRPLDRLRYADAVSAATPTTRWSRASSASAAWRSPRWPTWRSARRPAARPDQHLDDDQLAGGDHLGDVPGASPSSAASRPRRCAARPRTIF